MSAPVIVGSAAPLASPEGPPGGPAPPAGMTVASAFLPVLAALAAGRGPAAEGEAPARPEAGREAAHAETPTGDGVALLVAGPMLPWPWPGVLASAPGLPEAPRMAPVTSAIVRENAGPEPPQERPAGPDAGPASGPAGQGRPPAVTPPVALGPWAGDAPPSPGAAPRPSPAPSGDPARRASLESSANAREPSRWRDGVATGSPDDRTLEGASPGGRLPIPVPLPAAGHPAATTPVSPAQPPAPAGPDAPVSSRVLAERSIARHGTPAALIAASPHPSGDTPPESGIPGSWARVTIPSPGAAAWPAAAALATRVPGAAPAIRLDGAGPPELPSPHADPRGAIAPGTSGPLAPPAPSPGPPVLRGDDPAADPGPPGSGHAPTAGESLAGRASSALGPGTVPAGVADPGPGLTPSRPAPAELPAAPDGDDAAVEAAVPDLAPRRRTAAPATRPLPAMPRDPGHRRGADDEDRGGGEPGPARSAGAALPVTRPVTDRTAERPEEPAAPRPVVEQIAARVGLLLRERRQAITLRLDPPELGGVRIDAVIEGHRLSLRIRAEREPAREVLVESLPRLAEALARQGIETGQVTVELGLSAFAGETPRDGRTSAWWREADPLPARAPAGPPPAPAPARAPADPGRVDLWV